MMTTTFSHQRTNHSLCWKDWVKTASSAADAILNPLAPSWYPNPIEGEDGGVFIYETGRSGMLSILPNGLCKYTIIEYKSPPLLHNQYLGKCTYYPSYSRLCIKENGVALGPWSGNGYSLVGQYVLILVNRMERVQMGTSVDYKIPLVGEEDGHMFYVGKKFYFRCEEPEEMAYTEEEYKCEECPDYCWMFAFVDSWDSRQNTHTLVFREKDIFYTIPDVNLKRCVFQDWSNIDIEILSHKEAFWNSVMTVIDASIRYGLTQIDDEKNNIHDIDKETLKSLRKQFIHDWDEFKKMIRDKTPRSYDELCNEWVDLEPSFMGLKYGPPKWSDYLYHY